MLEHRTTPRAQTGIPGRATFVRGSSATVSCLISDLSPSGARVVFSAGTRVPAYFDLYIGQSGPHRAKTVWQQPGMAGVIFSAGRANVPEVLPG
ncbi:hypothetical protein MOX02_61760 [Methylobacterium oxalidis]|uniref:PilZ domain-containing protein n=2 Tax=Methylobacterium oxalidis TaxID=944322 RepID=A0A512JDY3_9HYPH|nr:hypothetical protein MOX02_61760 [Methylobacterium oxalidis]